MNSPMGDILWTPDPNRISGAVVTSFRGEVNHRLNLNLASYDDLFHWSVADRPAFWRTLWEFAGVVGDGPGDTILTAGDRMPGARWFPEARLNFAENLLRGPGEREAIVFQGEVGETRRLSMKELRAAVARVAGALAADGVRPGDRVAGFFPNLPEAVIAMLATASLGAVWSSCSPDFGVQGVCDRFGQIEPKVLFTADGYRYGGKAQDSLDTAAKLQKKLPSLVRLVVVPFLADDPSVRAGMVSWNDYGQPGTTIPEYRRVAFDHPLYIMFSSGTTGLPKAIVHSHQGALMEMLKVMTFHLDLRPDDISFFYTTTGWVMFNLTVAMMLTGSKAVYYDGNPASPTPDVLWKMVADTKATLFGASPTYVQLMEQLGVVPKDRYDLYSLRSVLCSGSPAQPESFEWFYNNVSDNIWLTSQSGGTEIVGGFVAASPTLPVYAGEIQCRALGMDVEAWSDEGEPLVGEVGELVCKKPFPSMPIYFLNDPEYKRYNESYFEDYPGAWRHGDFIKINGRGGSYIYGRSDSTLNRFGVRVGTSELYRTAEKLTQVTDSLVVCIELPGGKFFMPMFLQLADGAELTTGLEQEITAKLRADCSPRHVPDKYYVVPEIPYTLTGKKLEVPVRKLLLGWPLEKAASRDSMRNPEAIDFFLDYVATTQDYAVPEQQG